MFLSPFFWTNLYTPGKFISQQSKANCLTAAIMNFSIFYWKQNYEEKSVYLG